jgi:hypothetical protein
MELVRDLLKHNANTEIRSFPGCNPLGWAIYKDHIEVARLLTEYGADVKAQDTMRIRRYIGHWNGENQQLLRRSSSTALM